MSNDYNHAKLGDNWIIQMPATSDDIRHDLAALIWWEFGWTEDDPRTREAAKRAADAILGNDHFAKALADRDL